MSKSVFDLNKSQRILLDQMKEALVQNTESKDARMTLMTVSLSDGRMASLKFVLEIDRS